VATKKGLTTNFFSPLSFVAAFGSGILDPRVGIRDPEWVKIRIRDKHPGSATLFLLFGTEISYVPTLPRLPELGPSSLDMADLGRLEGVLGFSIMELAEGRSAGGLSLPPIPSRLNLHHFNWG
jgi:hypothetical protein